MTKYELCKKILALIEPQSTPDPDAHSDGEILDLIYELVRGEI